MSSPPPAASAPCFADHIIAFARTLRTAGMPIASPQVLNALHCVHAVGPRQREDVYWALRAALVHRAGDGALFDQAFHLFFRHPRLLEQILGLINPMDLTGATALEAQALRRQMAEALGEGAGDDPAAQPGGDARLTSSAREVLSTQDFERMSARELAEAKAVISTLLPALPRRPSRRRAFSPTGPRIDLRRTLRRAHRYAGELGPLARVTPVQRPMPIVLLCDVSGSMSTYSRLFLHFAHALTAQRSEVYSFVFATRLSHVTRALALRDPDMALDRVCAQVQDWAGGTRIGHCLREFNHHWARRVLSDRATVVLLSDGLERELTDLLALEAARLGRTARRWIWLNPLLRYEGFEPRAEGIRTLLPHVSECRPAHSLRAFAELADSLSF